MLDYITTAAAIKSCQLVGRYPHLAPDREDIQQDIIIMALDRWSQYDPSKSSPRTYISRVISNLAASIARRSAPRQIIIPSVTQEKGVGWIYAVHEIIASLPPKTQMVAKLTMEGYIRRDLCRMAGISVGELYRDHFPALRLAFRDYRNEHRTHVAAQKQAKIRKRGVGR